MISKQILREIVIRQKEKKKVEPLIKRDLLDDLIKYFKDDRIIIITGLRRSGKSTLLLEFEEYLKSQKEGYYYVNFEDEKFLDFKAQNFEELNEVLMEIHGDFNTYLFDEVQNIVNFESFVRRLHNQGKKIIITGSNSSLLSRELGTKLTGRYKSLELFPFSFKEFLRFYDYQEPKNEDSIKEKVKIFNLFKEYYEVGGIPEYIKNRDEDYIKTLYENIIYKDIISRYNLRNQKTFKELINVLTTNLSSQFTYNKLKNLLKLSNAITVKEYISYLTNTYLFFELTRFDYSIKKQTNLPKKAYLIDHMFNKILGFNLSENKGKILENIAFIELKRRNKEVYYFQNKGECDFIVKTRNKIKDVIQVCFELNKENKKREFEGLIEALKEFKLKKGVILTYEQEDEIKENGFTIQMIPLWKWLLKPQKITAKHYTTRPGQKRTSSNAHKHPHT